MSEYSRPASGFRLAFEGMKTNSSADSMTGNKYPYASNIRGYGESSIQSRPQIVQTQAAPSAPGTVVSLEPTIGIYKVNGGIFFSGTLIDSGYASGLGASLCPFRPSSSPNAYEYVFDQNKSSKVFVPSSGSPVVQKTGIAEPQTSPEACTDILNANFLPDAAANWGPTGTAGALADENRTTDTAVAFFQDPASVFPSLATRYSVQVGNVQYQRDQSIDVAKSSGGRRKMVVQDVMPAVNNQSTLFIQSIFFFSGSTGRCVIVPTQMPINNTVPQLQGDNPVGASFNSQQVISALRRGSLIQLVAGGGTEIVFVLSVTQGNQGLIAFECVTVNTHATGDAMIGIPAIGVSFAEAPALFVGQNINANAVKSTIAAGIGNIDQAFLASANPFIVGPSVPDPNFPTPQQDDYIHCSFNMDVLTNVTNIRVEFDINNGAADFAQNAFYFDIRQNDLLSAVTGTSTQLAAAQVALQRQNIDIALEDASIAPTINPGSSIRNDLNVPGIPDFASSSDQTTLGNSQWTEIMFPIRSLTRIGDDQARTLANCQRMRMAVTVIGNTVFKFAGIWFSSGGQADVGDTGILYFYRVRPRSSVTGVMGNPSPATRYGVSPRRQKIIVSTPSSAYDTQFDTWDIFRFGGQLTSWRYSGSSPVAVSYFVDNFFDLSIANNDTLDFKKFEPWPSIGPPIKTSIALVSGIAMTATFDLAAQNPAGFGTLSQLGSLLPGNAINIGNDVFTLYTRPTLVSTTGTTQTYLFQLYENAGSLLNPLVFIQEPSLAAQPSNRVWGPDANGRFFSAQAGAVSNNGIGLRAGLIQWCNANDPDSCSDTDTKDLCPPTEPIINGMIAAGYPVAMSAKRAWRGFFQSDGSYSWNEIPITRGIAAEFGVCTDGSAIYYVAIDGIRSTQAGSLTDADLYNIFPHEGIFPVNYTYAGKTIFPPEYKYASNMRLACVNNFLYFDYLDANQNQRTLVCDLRKGAWCDDTYSGNIAIHAGTTNPASNQKIPASAVRNQQLFFGDTSGAIYAEQSSPVAGNGEVVSCAVFTREEMVGDIRANKIFGDAAVDVLPAGSNMTVTPVFFGTVFGTVTAITGGQSARPVSPPTINLSGEQIKRSLGLAFSWTDQGTTSSLYLWQISYITQPEDISNRITDWSAPAAGNWFFQGFQIVCDTLNVVKTLAIRDGDALIFHDFVSDNSTLTTDQIKANGQQTVTCSFVTPFRAHLARIEPQDLNTWRLFGEVKWIAEPTPEAAMNWITQPTSHGQPGYQHCRQMLFAYNAPAQVIFSLTLDGVPQVYALPATTRYQKVLIPFAAVKGLVFQYGATSTQPFQIWREDLEWFVRSWGDAGPYRSIKMIGDSMSPRATI